jgi:hypothetical protein
MSIIVESCSLLLIVLKQFWIEILDGRLSQDMQPSQKGKEPERPSASDGASTDRNNTSSESTGER